jgi:hypothetical protein
MGDNSPTPLLLIATRRIRFSSYCFLFLLRVIQVSGFSVDDAPLLPMGPDALLRQASSAVRAAMDDGIHRQTIRMPLSESMYSEKEESFVADRAIGWQGGPQETFRFISPLAQQLLRDVSNDDGTGLTPKVQEQILLDFDGSSLLNAQSPLGPLKDTLGMVQPNTDKYYMELIQRMEEQFSDTPGKAKRMFLLINPAWRDANSWGFLQKKLAQETIVDRYETTYALDQFIVKGKKMSLLRAWPCDWCVYVTPLPQPGSDAPTNPRLLGTFSKRPEYSEIERVLV